MNSGGLAAVLPSTSVVEEESVVIPNDMTHADERFSARWKERCARFLGCIESAKLIAGRTKQRQEKAQIERLKKERAEMEKYRQRYLEAAMKQHMEQQVKPREMVSSITQSHSHHHPQLLSSSQNYPGYVQSLRTTAPFAPSYPSMSVCKPNIRKRPFEGSDGWTQYAHMAIMNNPRNIYHGKEPEMFQNNASPIQITNSFKYSTMISKQVPYCPTNSYNGGDDSNKSMTKEMQQMNYIVPELEKAEQYDQAKLGSSILPTTSQAQESGASTISEEMNNLSSMPELAESHVKDLMDQIGPSNSLDDLGGNCLEGVLVNRCDEESSKLAAETEMLQVHSVSSSIVSPMSATCGTPNNAVSPAHLSASARCSTNSFYDSHSAAVTPQQSALTPSCDQSQRFAVTPALAVPASPIMVQENSLLCTRNASSSSSTSSIGSTTAMPPTSSQVGNNNINGGSSSVNDGNVYSNTTAVPALATVSSQQLHQPQQQQQYYPVTHFQQYHHSCHQQQQLLNLFNNGCHVSTNNATLSHMDNTRIYNGIEYPRFGHCYNHYNNHQNKSSIFPRFPSQSLVECSTTQQYDIHSMKYPNNGVAYYAQQPEMNMQQQTYQFQVPLFQPGYHHHHYHGSGNDPMTATQSSIYPMNHF
ncbi:hypothetical protein X798_07758 [Onchocerca flexuosa]|uniref:Uncharacterized protein n=1 Tax=Onchocerca flexuosa TaxID=387005 RepID=A0A238BJ74_9BILA|nr:hypothetical protein X798_07758 [Onchocerca flexuosa]